MSFDHTKTEALSNSYHQATGPVPFRLCNDYLFRSLMQVDENALVSLIQSIIRLPDGIVVSSAEILNPIELGAAINEKDFLLDVLVKFNNEYRINIEMQISNESDWPERSLSYLCRTFDHLNKGEAYQSVKTAVQISLLDYTLFPDQPEFYSSYRMINEKTGRVYSDKLQLYVVCLNHIELASEADRMYQLDQWARFFRARTWEELHMITKDNPVLEQAAGHLHKLTQEEKIRYQCEARERWLLFERSKAEYRKELEEDLAQRIREIDLKDQEIDQQSQQIDQQIQQLDQQSQQLDQQSQQLDQQSQQLDQQSQQLNQQSQQLDQQSQQLDQQSQQLDQERQKNSALSDENARLLAEIAALKQRLDEKD